MIQGRGSQWYTKPTELSTIQMTTTIVCPMMYCGVPKNRAVFSDRRPNASSPNGLMCRGPGMERG
jgi:hypothetical protein